MGSFTSATARILMDAVFPTSTTSHTALAGGSSTATAYKIYNNSDTAGQVGLRLVSAGTAVLHSCDLVVGTVTTSNVGPGTGLTDGNFVSGASNASIKVGTIGLSTTPAGGGTNTVTYPTQTQYNGYVCKVMVASASGNHTWTGWTLTETSGKGQAVSNGQIGFPQLATGSNGCTVWGFVISARAADAAPATANTLIAAASAANTTAPLIIAYGDLSASRALGLNDTPVFANNAITITLD